MSQEPSSFFRIPLVWLPTVGNGCLVCNCERTMEIDGDKLAGALGASGPLAVHRHLCRAEIEQFEAALEDGGPLLVACTQEAPLFRELADVFAGREPTAGDRRSGELCVPGPGLGRLGARHDMDRRP